MKKPWVEVSPKVYAVVNRRNPTIAAGNPCDWHVPHGLGYLSHFQWADEQTSKGYEQQQCPDCGHWFFPEQLGKKPNFIRNRV